MAAAAPSTRVRTRRARSHPAVRFTLLDLVRVVSEVTNDEREVVATVQHLLETGRVRLTGNFRGKTFQD